MWHDRPIKWTVYKYINKVVTLLIIETAFGPSLPNAARVPSVALALVQESNYRLNVLNEFSRVVKHTCHISREIRNAYRMLVGMPDGNIILGRWKRTLDIQELKWKNWDLIHLTWVDGKMILKWVFMEWDGEAWTGLVWFRTGTVGEHWWTRLWTFGFRKMRGISWLAENRLLLKKDSAQRN